MEIPGILEVRKQVSRYFPFNDACQWFIDRADIIFLVYDPSKLDVGPETEAILDQLKGREYQTRILLNKADQVKPEELLRVQGALIWNISPLMSSAQPPVMYTVSLWSHPFENGAPIRLLQAQERAFLTDLREAIDKRIENKIASARRFAVSLFFEIFVTGCSEIKSRWIMGFRLPPSFIKEYYVFLKARSAEPTHWSMKLFLYSPQKKTNLKFISHIIKTDYIINFLTPGAYPQSR